MPKLNLNDLQVLRLWEFLVETGKNRGRPHGRRLQRLHEGLQVGPILEKLEDNQERASDWQEAAQEAQTRKEPLPPKPVLYMLKADSEPAPRELDGADLEFVFRVTRVWDQEEGSPVNFGQQYQVYVPLMDEIDRAFAETGKSMEPKFSEIHKTRRHMKPV